jgi:DNA-binding transcriptional ArsR family regulator
MNVPQLEYILIHPANDALKELQGCIAPVWLITGHYYFIFLRPSPGQSVFVHGFRNYRTNSPLKINFEKPIGCTYICNQSASYLTFMRRDIFQAIADPTRRAILVLIAVHAMTPNAIAEHFDITRQSISKHLRILSECELLAQKQEGREIFYELKIDKMREIDIWLDQFRKITEESFQRLDQVLFTIKNKKK